VNALREPFWDLNSAARAGLRGSLGWHPDQSSTSLCRFVLEHHQEGRPTLVTYVSCQESSGKPADIQILNRDQPELGDQSSGQPVAVVMPEVSNPLMLTSQKESSLFSPMRALLPTA